MPNDRTIDAGAPELNAEAALAEIERLLSQRMLIAFGDPEEPEPPKFLDVAHEAVRAICAEVQPEFLQRSLERLKRRYSDYDID